jgi:hypothetical protein
MAAAKRFNGLGVGASLLVALMGCGGAVGSDESLANPGEDDASAVRTAASAVTKTLYYEGSCAWLKCANGNDARGACGLGCSDSGNRFARDYSWRLSCSQRVQVAANGKSVYATVWDQSCCSRMEGNDGLLKALGISHGSGTCTSKGHFTYGYGQATATFTY